jgi:hypothetical protein
MINQIMWRSNRRQTWIWKQIWIWCRIRTTLTLQQERVRQEGQGQQRMQQNRVPLKLLLEILQALPK